jgi:hypothetical protein
MTIAAGKSSGSGCFRMLGCAAFVGLCGLTLLGQLADRLLVTHPGEYHASLFSGGLLAFLCFSLVGLLMGTALAVRALRERGRVTDAELQALIDSPP